MATPAEYFEEQILTNVKTTLEAIEAGGDYWYTPGVVVRTETWEPLFKSPEHQIMYGIRDSSESIKTPELEVFGKDVRDFQVFLLLAYRDDREESPFDMDPPRGRIRHRMIRDVTKKLYEDRSRGDLAIHTEVQDATKDFERIVHPWILAEVPVSILYEHSLTAP
jgi:hypothetical protein